MSLHGCAESHPHGVKQDPFLATANLANRDEHGSLIMDRVGRILSGGAAAERVFGASEGRLIGRRISELVTGLVLEGNTPSDTARYLTSLWADGKWRHFEAIQIGGLRFDVVLSLRRVVTDGEEFFLVNLRRRDMNLMADVMNIVDTIAADRFSRQSDPFDSHQSQQPPNELSRSFRDQALRLAAQDR